MENKLGNFPLLYVAAFGIGRAGNWHYYIGRYAPDCGKGYTFNRGVAKAWLEEAESNPLNKTYSFTIEVLDGDLAGLISMDQIAYE